MSIIGSKPVKLYKWDSSNNVWEKWDGTLDASDIQVGAVEIKDGDSDTRADIETDGTKNALFTQTTPSKSVEGAPVTVGTSAVEMTFSAATKGVFIQADHDNTGTVWVGGSNVDNAGANAFVRLEAGGSVSMDMDDSADAIYAVSDTASQTVLKMALL